MAFTPAQEQALLALLAEKRITLDELPKVTQLSDSDLLFTRQNITEKSVTAQLLKKYTTPPPATLKQAGIIQLSNALDSDLETTAATSKAVKNVVENMEKYLPVGIPLPWPTAIPPTGWLPCNGTAFDKVRYPKLAAVYPTGTLPDLRGEFIRGWDNNRNIDPTRTLLSHQWGTIVSAGDPSTSAPCVVSLYNSIDNNVDVHQKTLHGEPPHELNTNRVKTVILSNATTDGISVKITSMSVRPRNIAFNYIVRAE